MSQNPDSSATLSSEQTETVIRVIRALGLGFILCGLMAFAGIGGIGELLGLTDSHLEKTIGALLMAVGLLDVVVVPMLLRAKRK